MTNRQFAAFVAATGYVTVAERPLDPARHPGADPARLGPGSLVFRRTAGPLDARDLRNWWVWTPGACGMIVWIGIGATALVGIYNLMGASVSSAGC